MCLNVIAIIMRWTVQEHKPENELLAAWGQNEREWLWLQSYLAPKRVKYCAMYQFQ